MFVFVKRNGLTKTLDLPKLKITGSVSDVVLMLTPYTYCHVINISRLLFPGQTEVPNDCGKKTDKTQREFIGNPHTFAKLKKKAQFSGKLQK